MSRGVAAGSLDRLVFFSSTVTGPPPNGEHNSPSMLPGRLSSPKNSLLPSKASASRMRSWVRPSKPAISAPSLDCRPFAIFSTVNCRRPSLSTWYLLFLSPENTPCHICQRCNGKVEESWEWTYCLEHLQTCNSNTLRSPVDTAIFCALVAPLSPGTSVQQHADQEQINQTAALFGIVSAVPRGQQMRNPISSTHTKVLVSAMARDTRKRGIVVSLRRR